MTNHLLTAFYDTLPTGSKQMRFNLVLYFVSAQEEREARNFLFQTFKEYDTYLSPHPAGSIYIDKIVSKEKLNQLLCDLSGRLSPLKINENSTLKIYNLACYIKGEALNSDTILSLKSSKKLMKYQRTMHHGHNYDEFWVGDKNEALIIKELYKKQYNMKPKNLNKKHDNPCEENLKDNDNESLGVNKNQIKKSSLSSVDIRHAFPFGISLATKINGFENVFKEAVEFSLRKVVEKIQEKEIKKMKI